MDGGLWNSGLNGGSNGGLDGGLNGGLNGGLDGGLNGGLNGGSKYGFIWLLGWLVTCAASGFSQGLQSMVVEAEGGMARHCRWFQMAGALNEAITTVWEVPDGGCHDPHPIKRLVLE